MRRLLAFLLFCLTLPAFGQEPSQQQRFAQNNSLFVLYHEVAHLLFDQLDLPVLGREEDAADNVATWILLNKKTQDAHRTLNDAVEGWFYSGIAYDSGGHESDFAASYSLDKQRAYQIVCLMVGMDRAAFRPLANRYSLLAERQKSCRTDYQTIDRALRGLLADPPRGGKSATITVAYQPAGGRLRGAADTLRRSGILDSVAEELRTRPLPRPVQFTARRCGEANAFYDADTIEIIFCYELMQDYLDLYAQNYPMDHRGAGPGRSKIDAF